MRKKDDGPDGLTTDDVPFLADGAPDTPVAPEPEPTVTTPGYEEQVAAGVEGGIAPASQCTFPGCGQPRVDGSYMCSKHTAAQVSAEAAVRPPETLTE